MKYIRTKDGKIFDTNKICVPYQVVESWIDFNSQGRFEIIKQADTIEELCDELIINNPNNDGVFYRKIFVYEGTQKDILNERHARFCTNRDIYVHDVEIFGAIWVIDSNGAPTLKSVAKMNEKGELELL